jgi:hypothetical protein
MGLRLFGGRTVASITGKLGSLIRELEAHEEDSIASAVYHGGKAMEHQEHAERHDAEAANAARVRGKIAALIA